MSTGNGHRRLNAMSVDVEEHFQVSAFDGVIDRDQWDAIPSRVAGNTDRLLDLFDTCGVKATFFVLGWVAEKHPQIARRIADRGHEIGSHGFSHRLIYSQQPETFRAELSRSRKVLQDQSGQSVEGHRAASFSITRRSLWALDILAEEGFGYDSSIFPVVHDRYGLPGAPRRIYRLRTPGGHSLVEVPPSTCDVAGVSWPVGGGGYLRLYPTALTRWAIRRLNDQDARAAIVYIHPWEVDPEQPRVQASWRSRFRHYVGLTGTSRKLRDLMRHHRFGPVRQVVEESGTLEEHPLQ